MHIDMNSFFASVEQQTQPALRGKPVVVLAYVSARGCVLASSVEAKRDYGIRTGMTYVQAREQCPHVIGLPSDPQKYRDYSERFIRLCRQYSVEVEQYSIDEAFLDLDWSARNEQQALKVALEIKQRLAHEVGDWLRASVGIAPTRFLAKLAGDSMKPDGLVLLRASDLPQWYRGRDIESAWGIGPSTAAKLRAAQIETLYDLFHADPVALFRMFGRSGYGLWAKLRGMEVEELETDRLTDQKSISAQYSLPFRTTDPEKLHQVLMKLCERVGRRLRRQGKIAQRVFCFWRCYDSSGDALHEELSPKVADTYPIFDAVTRMFSCRRVSSPYRLIGVGVSKLTGAGQEQRLFEMHRTERLTPAMDTLNDRFGEYTVYHGAMMGGQEHAKDAVGFRRVSEFV